MEVALFKVKPLYFKAIGRIYSAIKGTLAYEFRKVLNKAINLANWDLNLEISTFYLLAKLET